MTVRHHDIFRSLSVLTNNNHIVSALLVLVHILSLLLLHKPTEVLLLPFGQHLAFVLLCYCATVTLPGR